MRILFWLFSGFAWAVLSPSAPAQSLRSELPELVGRYLGPAGQPPLAVDSRGGSVGPFDAVSHATLRLTGSYAPGVYGDLNDDLLRPLPGGLYVELRQQGQSVAFDSIWLDPQSPGNWEAQLELQPTTESAIPWPLAEGGLDVVLAGATPLLVGTAVLWEAPDLWVEFAELEVVGTPAGGFAATEADLNRDGVIDGRDFALWEQSLAPEGVAASQRWLGGAGATLLRWQRHFDSTAPLVAVPEPCFSVVAGSLLLFALRRAKRFGRAG